MIPRKLSLLHVVSSKNCCEFKVKSYILYCEKYKMRMHEPLVKFAEQ